MKKSLSIFSLFLFFLNSAYAELHECNGTWTNKPCEELSKIPEKKSNPIAVQEKSKKESILHDLRMLSIKAKNDYDIRYSIAVIEDKCKSSSLEECDKLTKDAQKELQTLINQSQETRERNDLLREQNRLSRERNEIEANKPPVIIQQNTVIVPNRIRPLPGYDPRYPNNDPRFKQNVDGGQNPSSPVDVKLPE